MKTQYLTDTTGKKTDIILSIRDYEKVMEDLEDLEDIKAYDRAKTRKSESVPFEKALKEIELLRNSRVKTLY